jgi:hypothetical protein
VPGFLFGTVNRIVNHTLARFTRFCRGTVTRQFSTQYFDQSAIEPREIDIFLSLFSQFELVYEIGHGPIPAHPEKDEAR